MRGFKGCKSADQQVKDQRGTHKPDNFNASNNLLFMNKKIKKHGNCGFNLHMVKNFFYFS